ncbi:MAG: aminofutalosine synthase MqnE [Bacteroidetes bacterium]|nr:MAG: aminofutalosine synthase MqnE [Bacteroidota bacterium]
MTHLPDYITNDALLSTELLAIGNKVYQGDRISPAEGLALFEDAPLAFLGHLANFVREKRHGSVTYFNRNFHIEPTNVCVYDCKFCSYSQKIKKREDGWEYTADDMMDIVRSYDEKPVTEVHIVGGVLPQYDLEFYENLFSTIRTHRPELHIKALTPVEYHYVFKKAGISYEVGMQRMKDAGLASMPGGGAEIFHPEIREVICKDKCDADQWLEIHKIWHQLGMRSNATILYGHIEKYHHRVDHMERLRLLQDETGGFQTFIPLKFRNKDNQMSDLEEESSIEDLRNYAISRIYLDNFDHIKAYWPMIGRATAQLSLAFGVDDIDGTIDDTTKIYTMAGSEEQNPALTTEEMVNLIKLVGRIPVERGTLYDVIKDYSEFEFEGSNDFQGYVSLPVVEHTNGSDKS